MYSLNKIYNVYFVRRLWRIEWGFHGGVRIFVNEEYTGRFSGFCGVPSSKPGVLIFKNGTEVEVSEDNPDAHFVEYALSYADASDVDEDECVNVIPRRCDETHKEFAESICREIIALDLWKNCSDEWNQRARFNSCVNKLCTKCKVHTDFFISTRVDFKMLLLKRSCIPAL